MGETGQSRSVLGDVMQDLQRVFRHFLPGLLILGAARAGHPRWFDRVAWNEPWCLITLAVLAIVVGDAWYLVHRYTVEQTLDWLLFVWWRKKLRGYREWLIPHLRRGQGAMPVPAERQYFNLRSAHTTYVFILAEAVTLFAFAAQTGSFLYRHRTLAFVGAGVVAAAALWQWAILDALDCAIAGTDPKRGPSSKKG